MYAENPFRFFIETEIKFRCTKGATSIVLLLLNHYAVRRKGFSAFIKPKFYFGVPKATTSIILLLLHYYANE